MARTSKRFRQPPPRFLLTFPGEIRNQIYQLCILTALKLPKAPRSAFSPVPAATDPAMRVSVLPRWKGPAHFRLEGIGALPILFVNKQTYREVHSLVHSMVQNISIGGYILQFPGEDPSERWERAYALIRQRTALQFVKQVTVTLPSVREDLFRNRWEREIGYDFPENPVMSTPWSILPGLVRLLQTFNSLSTLKIIVTGDGSNAPNLEALEPFYDVCPHGTLIEWRSGRP